MIALLQMDVRSLAMEIAPLIIWQQGQKPDYFDQYSHFSVRVSSKNNTTDSSPTYSAWDILSGEYFVSVVHLVLWEKSFIWNTTSHLLAENLLL